MTARPVAAVALLLAFAAPVALRGQDELRTRVAWSSHCGDVTTTGHLIVDGAGNVTATVVRSQDGAPAERVKFAGHAVTIKAPQTVCTSSSPAYQLLIHGTFVRTAQQAAGAAPQTTVENVAALPVLFDNADDAGRAYREIRCVLLPERCVH